MDDDTDGQVKTGLGYSDCRVVHLRSLIIQIVRRNPVIYFPANKKTDKADKKIRSISTKILMNSVMIMIVKC